MTYKEQEKEIDASQHTKRDLTHIRPTMTKFSSCIHLVWPGTCSFSQPMIQKSDFLGKQRSPRVACMNTHTGLGLRYSSTHYFGHIKTRDRWKVDRFLLQDHSFTCQSSVIFSLILLNHFEIISFIKIGANVLDRTHFRNMSTSDLYYWAKYRMYPYNRTDTPEQTM